ncbi:MAG: oxidoreductase [Rhodospirillales bacterium]|uniref:NAD(P)H-dependent flavin oxidoreductase n=1 Tax=Hwanghaeella sp. 1Z406 TaxID=3402811 RepID=UPI000C98EEDB|nr:oxidoreductase [Rhodospirillales bacterium]MAO93714.1 oxidoreductase [Rhodospirillales bacterium]
MGRITTRLTRQFGIDHPILSAPMAGASGGQLAKAVSEAGGLGLIGGGYGDATFLSQAFRDAGNTAVGCGFITWSLAQNPDLLDLVLSHNPCAIMLSFGDPGPFVAKIAESDVPLICQCQTIAHVRQAVDLGATVIVAQGGEAGGHGALRGTMNFVPEVADLLAANSPDTLLVAAGGIADGRGLAAALMLGADGVLVGTRFWASLESLAPMQHRKAAIPATGDDTVQTTAVDIVRQKDWPAEFKVRVQQNAFTQKWHGHEEELRAVVETAVPAYTAALEAGDPQQSAPICGEAIGLIASIEPAARIVETMVEEAHARLNSRFE